MSSGTLSVDEVTGYGERRSRRRPGPLSALVLVVANVIDLSDRVGRQRLLATDLPARRDRGLPATGRHERPRRDRLAAIVVTAIVLVFFAVDTLRNAPDTFAAIVAITLLSVALDFIWKRSRAAGGQPGLAAGGGETAPPPVAERLDASHPARDGKVNLDRSRRRTG